MNILSIDTTGKLASVAVMTDENKIIQKTSSDEMNHLSGLLPMAEEALSQAGLSKKQIGLIGVSLGPGSFTGIRIGVATAKTLAQALGVPIVGVQTLESFAYGGSAATGILFCPMLDARRHEVYAGAFVKEEVAGVKTVIESAPYDVDDFLRLVAEAVKNGSYREVRILGDGVDSYMDSLDKAIGEIEKAGAIVIIPEGQDRYQQAAYVAAAALEAASEGRTSSYNDIKPVYLRKAYAETQLESNQLGKGKKKRAEAQQMMSLADLPSPDEKITVRMADDDDIPAMVKLDADCFHKAWSEESFRSDMPADESGRRGFSYAAAENSRGELIGFAGVNWILDEGEINRVAVNPLYRGRNIAGQMLDQILKSAEDRGVKAVTLEVREANAPAIALYKSRGFKVEGKREGYYAATGENALIMWRRS